MPNKPPLLYREEGDNFLKSFIARDKAVAPQAAIDEVRKDMADAFNDTVAQGMTQPSMTPEAEEHPALHPIAMAMRVMQKRRLARDGELGRLTEIIEKTYPRDDVTGYYAKQCMPVMVGLAHMNATAPGNTVPVSLVEGDFTNMGGCNKSALGREGTDKLIRRICDIVEGSFHEYAVEKHRQPIETHGIRAGGDEVRVLVYGLKPEEVKEVLDTKVHPRVNLLSAEYGVHKVPHEKKGKMAGFGAAFAAVDLAKAKNLALIRDELDAGIEARKTLDGMLRMGVVDEPGVQRYIREVMEPYFQEKHTDANLPAIENYVREKAKEAAAEWKILTQDASAGNEYRQGAGKKPDAFFDEYSQRHAGSVQSKLDNTPITASVTAVPFSDVKVAATREAPQSIRLRKALMAMNFDDVANASESLFKWNNNTRRYDLQRPASMKYTPERSRTLRLVIDLMLQFDAPDPASRCKAPQLLVDDAKELMERLKDEGAMRVLQFELGNMNGLNAVNYDLADAALRETGKHIQDVLLKHHNGMGTHVVDYVYHEGGGKFKVLLPITFSKLDADMVAKEVNVLLDERVRNKPIMEFAKATYANPSNGRGVESADKMEALKQRLAQLEPAMGKPLRIMADIPHPKDSAKSLTLKHYAGEVLDAQVMRPDGMSVDRSKMRTTLESISAKANIEFNRTSTIQKVG